MLSSVLIPSTTSDESTMAAIMPILGTDFPFYVFGNNANRAAWVRRQANFVVMDFHLVSTSFSVKEGVSSAIPHCSTFFGTRASVKCR